MTTVNFWSIVIQDVKDMKRFLISFVLIFALLFNVFADNKKAHKELRAEFEKCVFLPELKSRGLDLKKLDKIDDLEEMKDYLSQFFIDENGIPLDNHLSIQFEIYGKNYSDRYKSVKTSSSMQIEWSDEYGSKDELLNKGYKEDEIFYYPYFNGEWKDGYRVGKKYMGETKDSGRKSNYSVNSEKTLLVGLDTFKNGTNDKAYEEISNSDKEYLILDLSYNGGGNTRYSLHLVDAIEKMKPKEIFIIIDNSSVSMGEIAAIAVKKATNIKTTIVGYPTAGAWKCTKKLVVISFDKFNINCRIDDGGANWKWVYDTYNIPYPTEGIGATPDIYTDGSPRTSLEVIKYLINDNELTYPY